MTSEIQTHSGRSNWKPNILLSFGQLPLRRTSITRRLEEESVPERNKKIQQAKQKGQGSDDCSLVSSTEKMWDATQDDIWIEEH